MTASNFIRPRHLAVALVAVAAIFHHATGVAQPRGRRQGDSTAIDSTIRKTGAPLIITVPRTPTLQSLPDVQGTSLFSGKKSEQISVAQMDGNLAVNNTRQVFSHAAGIQIWEFDGSGIQANVAARGLNPHRSSEFNVRMNGYDIASDPYGYPEVHFTPPFESLERIDVVRGAAALQYGSQFGGLLNYITKSAPPERPIALEASQSGGSYGLYSTYTSLRGTIDQFSYDGYLDFRRSDGWRESGSYWFVTGNGRVTYDISPDARLGLELTAMQFKEHMPNGLTEKQYAENPRASYRPRDWFGAPRIMPALTYDQKISDQTRLSVKAAGLAAERNSITLVSSTAIADTGTNRRRVNRDIFRDVSLEARLLTQFDLLTDNRATLATGFRMARTNTDRSQGLGMDGSDFNLEYRGVKTLDLDFVSYNVAAFGELKIPLVDGLAVTPGVRIEHLNTGATGTYAKEKAATSLFAFDTLGPIRPIDRTYQETFPLFGLGLSASLSESVNLYGNFSQAYRPLLYAQEFPYDQIPVDSAVTSSKGYSTDLGVRGRIAGIGSFDVNGFFLQYNDRIGIIFPDSTLYPSGLRTNVGASRHYGIESFGELDLMGIASGADQERESALLLFTSIGYTSATYTKGPANGKKVENSPEWIVRSGLTCRLGRWLSTTLQGSYVSSAFSDAANTPFRADGQQGVIPEYSVFDFSMEARVLRSVRLEASVNNLLDRKYFTARATAYPGPGILPGDGRTFMAGVRLAL